MTIDLKKTTTKSSPAGRHLFLPFVAALVNVLLLQWSLVKLLTSQDSLFHVTPLRWILSIVIPLVLVLHGYRKRSITTSGVLSGALVGFSMVIGSYCVMSSVVICYLATSYATRHREDIKSKFEANFRSGGQRNWIQIVCNLSVANALVLLRLILFGVGEFVIDFNQHNHNTTTQNLRPSFLQSVDTTYYNSWLLVGSFSAIACALGDTLSSELGPVWSEGQDPLLVTTFRPVPRGTNGGITISGLIAASLGGFLVGVVAFITQTYLANSYSINLLSHWSSPPQWPIILFCLYAGLFGSLIDSLLGATVQYTGYNRLRGRIVESPPNENNDPFNLNYIEHISGRDFLDNHSVNLVSILLTSIIVPYLAAWFWPNGSSI